MFCLNFFERSQITSHQRLVPVCNCHNIPIRFAAWTWLIIIINYYPFAAVIQNGICTSPLIFDVYVYWCRVRMDTQDSDNQMNSVCELRLTVCLMSAQQYAYRHKLSLSLFHRHIHTHTHSHSHTHCLSLHIVPFISYTIQIHSHWWAHTCIQTWKWLKKEDLTKIGRIPSAHTHIHTYRDLKRETVFIAHNWY